MTKRKLRANEIALITWMIQDTVEGKKIIDGLKLLDVEEMDDGGMGSLRVVTKDKRKYSRDLGRKADSFDIDNVPILITVYLDTHGDFFELDVFKGDFSTLKKFPDPPTGTG